MDPKRHDWGDSNSTQEHPPHKAPHPHPHQEDFIHESLPHRITSVASSNTLVQIPTEQSDSAEHASQSISIKETPQMRHHRASLGLHPLAPLHDDHAQHGRQDLFWSKIRVTFREPFAEFWGVVIMILFGNGSVAQVLLSTGQTEGAPGGNGFGNYQNVNWGWALGVMLGIYVAGDSGAYLNPAITFSNCLYRQLPWRRFPAYFIAQLLGGMVGSCIVYANYISAIDHYEGGHGIRTVPPVQTATAGVFATYPQPFVNKASQFFSEFIASAILMFVIFALKDEANMGMTKSAHFFPLMLFFLIYGIGACFGWETGYAINLVRDFSPRLMSYGLGYGKEVWSAGGYYFWIPMVAPWLGCMFGGFLYDVFIYTGQSPVNAPYLGLSHFFHPRQEVRRKIEAEKDLQMV